MKPDQTAQLANASGSACTDAQWALRVDLAAAFRLAAQFEWTESVGNHFSAVVASADGTFLMNPRWVHFSLVRASELMLLNWNDTDVLSRPNPPDRSGWCIHSQMHATVPKAAVIMHIHPPYATALAGLKDTSIKPIEQVTARFFNRVAVDSGFQNVATTEEEGRRLGRVIGDKSVLMMGNHGVTVAAATVAEAFEELYLFERACRTLVLAYSTGQPLSILPDDVAEQTARGWEPCRSMAFSHFKQLKRKLDILDPGYAT